MSLRRGIWEVSTITQAEVDRLTCEKDISAEALF